MSKTTANLQRKISTASDLQSVVRTMKAISASNIGQYEQAVNALDGYARTVQLSLHICFKQQGLAGFTLQKEEKKTGAIAAIVFGSDQGLVGQFNEIMANFVIKTLTNLNGEKTIWGIGERNQTRLLAKKLALGGSFKFPNSIEAITPLVGHILIELDKQLENGDITAVHLFYHRPQTRSGFTAFQLRLLPLDEVWQQGLISTP